MVALSLELQIYSENTALGRNGEEGGRERVREGRQKGGLSLYAGTPLYILN